MTFKIFHAVERHEITDAKENDRRKAAHDSWQWMYATGGVVPCHYWKYERTARSIGERRDLPYLKDVLKFAMDQADMMDIIMITNDDIICHPWLLSEVTRHCGLYEVGCAHRTEIDGPVPSLTLPPFKMLEIGFPHMGRDLFVFTKEWLLRYWRGIPDFILGACDWDLCLALMIRKVHGEEKVTPESLYDCMLTCELPDGLILHQVHDAFWQKKEIQFTSQANNYNRELCKSWIKHYAPEFELKGVGLNAFPRRLMWKYKAYRPDFV